MPKLAPLPAMAMLTSSLLGGLGAATGGKRRIGEDIAGACLHPTPIKPDALRMAIDFSRITINDLTGRLEQLKV